MSSTTDTAAQPTAPMAPSPDPRPAAPASEEARAAPRRGHASAYWAKFNENAFASLIVAMIGVLMLVNINQTSDRMTGIEDRITRFEERVDARFAKFEAAVDARFAKLEADIDARFAKLEADVDARFTKLEADIDARFAKLEARMDAGFAAVDARLTRLEENQQEIAVTLARLVALLEGRGEAPPIASG